jgi:hypothetical protein
VPSVLNCLSIGRDNLKIQPAELDLSLSSRPRPNLPVTDCRIWGASSLAYYLHSNECFFKFRIRDIKEEKSNPETRTLENTAESSPLVSVIATVYVQRHSDNSFESLSLELQCSMSASSSQIHHRSHIDASTVDD